MTSDSIGLDLLEQHVARAAEEIARLRAEKRTLEKENRRLTAAAAKTTDGGAWEAERAELRGRVESLVQRLEGLLAVGDASSV